MAERISETMISKSIMEYLAARHVFAIRVNSGMMFSTYKGKKRAIHMAAPGTADLVIFPKGRVIWCEVKSQGCKQSDYQKSFEKKVLEEGHEYILAEGIDAISDVETAIK